MNGYARDVTALRHTLVRSTSARSSYVLSPAHHGKTREDAEDVMQDAFLKRNEKLEQFQGNSKFYTWLVRIAVNEA